MKASGFQQSFRYDVTDASCELTLDRDGLSLDSEGGQPRRVPWDAVRGLDQAPSEGVVRLLVDGGEPPIDVPFTVSGPDGGFDALIQTVLGHVDLGPEVDDLPLTFGRWRPTVIAAWAFCGAAGAALAVALVPLWTHWIIGAAVAALWLVWVWHGGLSRERRLTVERDGCVVHRLGGSRRYRLADISNLKVQLFPGPGPASRPGLVLTPRAGETVTLPHLGGETFAAYLALRQALRETSGRGSSP